MKGRVPSAPGIEVKMLGNTYSDAASGSTVAQPEFCHVCGQWPEMYCDECWGLKATIALYADYSEPWIRAEVEKVQRQLERRRKHGLRGAIAAARQPASKHK